MTNYEYIITHCFYCINSYCYFSYLYVGLISPTLSAYFAAFTQNVRMKNTRLVGKFCVLSKPT